MVFLARAVVAWDRVEKGSIDQTIFSCQLLATNLFCGHVAAIARRFDIDWTLLYNANGKQGTTMRKPELGFAARETAQGTYKFQAVVYTASRNGEAMTKTLDPHGKLL